MHHSRVQHAFWILCAAVVGITIALAIIALTQSNPAQSVRTGVFSFFNGVFSRTAEALASTLAPETAADTLKEPDGPLERKIALGTVADAAVTVPLSGKFILADLQRKRITLYENGTQVSEFAILSIGRKGTPWETPAGAYSVKTKEENHFSTFGEVWMPYSMQFFGNFFIHGWPYYSTGAPVPAGYSGGCIRLATDDARQVFAFADLQTPLAVINPNGPPSAEAVRDNPIYYFENPHKKTPTVTADAYLVADLDSSDIILQKNKDEVRPIASLTKLMTALTDLEVINQYRVATVSSRAQSVYPGDPGNLLTGTSMEVGQFLYPLLLTSSNVTAEVLAEHAGRANFIAQMNAKAKAIGLAHTSYEDPSGLSDHNVSTADDLMRLTRYIYQNKRFILDVTKLTNYTGDSGQVWYNNSRFHSRDGYLGGKNGYIDESKHTLITLFTVPLSNGEERNIAVVLLGSDNKQEDADALLSYLKQNVAYGPAPTEEFANSASTSNTAAAAAAIPNGG